MTEIIALIVRFIPVKNNFVHLHSNLLAKYRNSRNPEGCVAIKYDNKSKYCSCGATPINFNGENSFNVSATFAKSLGVNESETVIISSVDRIKSVEIVHVTPLSKEDWNILENSAETIQSSLLDQIRVLSIHQTFSVWISKSFSLEVHVDKLSTGITYGKLEQYTEIIVSSDVKICKDCEQGNINAESLNVDISSKSTWNFFKDIFSFAEKGEKCNPTSEVVSDTLEYNDIGIFRCLPYNDSVLDFSPKLFHNSYNVFVPRKYFVELSPFRSDDNPILCRLKNLPYVQPKSKLSSDESAVSFMNVISRELYVYLYRIDESNVRDKVTYASVNCYPSIYVSKVIGRFLHLGVNSKVKLDIVRYRKKKKLLSEVDFTILKTDNELTEEEIIKLIKNYACSYAKLYDNILLNNNCVFTFENATTDLFYVSFNPANTPFVELNSEEIDYCNFQLQRRDVDANLKDEVDRSVISDLFQFSFLEKILKKLEIGLLIKLNILSPSCKFDLKNSNYFLIEGDVGCGKTTIIDLLFDNLSKSAFGVFIKKISCKSLKGKLVPKLEKILKNTLIECVYHEPAVLCLDDLDVLFASAKDANQPQSEQSISSYSSRLSQTIRDVVRSFSNYRVAVCATASNVSNFDSCLFAARGSALFTDCVSIPVLERDMRREALLQFLRHKSDSIGCDFICADKYLERMVDRINGYCLQDVADLVDRAHFEAAKRQAQIGTLDDRFEIREIDIDDALAEFVPLSLRGIDFHKSSNVMWKDVGGLDETKKMLEEILIWPSKYPKIFEQCPLKMQSGVLLFGVPGSGKTLLASAVAGESELNFISIKGPELLSKYVGASEEAVRNTFRKARNAKPCILFFDEFDSLAPRRGNDITGVTDRVVNQLLTEMDGVESVTDVWILAATSRPDLIDPALLRPGRLGALVHCPLPNEAERLKILQIYSETMKLDENVDLASVATLTEGYTGADLRAILYSSQMIKDKITAASSTNELTEDTSVREEKIDNDCVMRALHETKPSLELFERLNYYKIYKTFLRADNGVQMASQPQKVTYA